MINIGIGNTFKLSWEITKQSFSVIRSDKEILLFPLLGSIFSIVFFVLMAVPYLLATFVEGTDISKLGDVAVYATIFAAYLGLAFISTFFNVGVVYCAKKRFEGGDPTFGEGMREAIKRIHLILLWALLSATVGLVLRMVENAVRDSKSNFLTRMIASFIISLIGAAWSIASIFVVPAIVFDNVGPFDALKLSVSTIKKTWGESIVRHYGLGLAQFVFVLLGAVVFILPGILLLGVSWQAAVAAFGLFVIYLVVVSLLFGTANTIFNTALYMYAHHEKAPAVFPAETLKNAFVPG